MVQTTGGRTRAAEPLAGAGRSRSTAAAVTAPPRRRGLAVGAGALAVLVLLTGCSGGSRGSAESAAGGAAAQVDAGGEQSGGTAASAGMPAASSVAADAVGSVGAGALVGRDVVVRGTLTVSTEDVTGAARAAADATVRLGGYVEQESTEPAGDGPTGEGPAGVQLTLRVPTAEFAGLRDEISALGDEESRSMSSEDVTDQVLDVEARLATQRASVERVRALLAQATDLSEVVAVEAELTRRQAELESLQARSDALASSVRLATLVVHVVEPGTRLAAATPGFLDGLERGWAALVAATGALLTVAGLLLPFAVAAALAAIPVLALRRRRSGRPAPVSVPAP